MKPLLFLAIFPFVLQAGELKVFVANSAANNITIIDPESNTVAGNFEVSRNPHAILLAPDKSVFYITSEGENVLDVVDRKTLKVVLRVPLGLRPNNMAITLDGRRIYVCIRKESRVDIVDTRSLEKVKSVRVGRYPHNVYCSPDGKQMIAASMGDRKLTVIDIKTEEAEFEIPVGGIPRPLAIEAGPGGAPRRLFVQLSDLHGFAVVDFAARRVVDKVMLPEPPPGTHPLIPHTFSHGIGVAPDGQTLWVASLLDDSVSVFSLPGLKHLDKIPVGHAPDWLTFTPDSKRCFVSNAGSNSVSVIDADSRKELARIPVGRVPKRIIVVELP